MRKLLAFLVALAMPAYGQDMILSGAGSPSNVGGGGPCAQATAFINRTSGLNTTHKNAYTNLICGLVSDGVWAKLDVMYVPATQDATSATLNLVSSSFTSAITGTVPFTIDTGYTANGASNFIDSGFNPSTAGGHYTATSDHFAYCATTVNTGGGVPIGNTDGSTFAELFWNGGSSTDLYMQQAGSGPASATGATTAGLWVGTRTASNAIAIYKNGVSQATNTTANSATLINFTVYLIGRNNAGTADQPGAGGVFAFFSIGGGLTLADSLALHNRMSAYMTAIGASGC